MKARRNMTMSSLYLHPDVHKRLAAYSKKTRIPRAVLLRQAVDEFLKRSGA